MLTTYYKRPALPHAAAVRRGTSLCYPPATYELDVPMTDDEARNVHDLLYSADDAMHNRRAPSNSYAQRVLDVIRAAVQDYSLPSGQVVMLVLSSTRGRAIASRDVSLPRRADTVHTSPLVREFDCTLAEYKRRQALKCS